MHSATVSVCRVGCRKPQLYLPRPSSGKLGLNVLLGKLEPRGDAVNNASYTMAMALAIGSNFEACAEGGHCGYTVA